jgi:hypothetical protein
LVILVWNPLVSRSVSLDLGQILCQLVPDQYGLHQTFIVETEVVAELLGFCLSALLHGVFKRLEDLKQAEVVRLGHEDGLSLLDHFSLVLEKSQRVEIDVLD